MTGDVVWRSPSNEVVIFQHIQKFLPPLLMVSKAPLIPNTTYMLSVCAVFSVGAVLSLTVVSSVPIGGQDQLDVPVQSFIPCTLFNFPPEKLAYFQIRLSGL